MAKIIGFELTAEQMNRIKELENSEDYMELKLVSGAEISACPYCRGGGCYGSCQMQGCYESD